MKPLILLTNDDGYFAEGILAMARHLRGAAETVIVAPDRRKALLPIAHPAPASPGGEDQKNICAVDGTPADCIYLALKMILTRCRA
jgi:5'-nucleotidase